MGCASCRDKDREIHVLLLGLPRSGKSTFIYCLDGINELAPYIPTQSSQVSYMEIFETKFEFYEAGSAQQNRSNWIDYLRYTDAIFYFVDMSDAERLKDALFGLKSIMIDKKTEKCSIFVFCNKMDKEYVVEKEQIQKSLEEILSLRKKYSQVFFVSCIQHDVLLNSIEEVIRSYYPSFAKKKK